MNHFRYLIFAGETYYPSRGIGDFRGSTETIEAALAWLAGRTGYDWWQIVDRQTMTVVQETY